MIKLSIMILMSVILIGCSSTKETFNCKYHPGVGCHSISEVNSMINEGKLKPELVIKSKSKSTLPGIFTLTNPNIKRVTEEHVTIWVAPFQDEHGNWHEACKVHTVLRAGFWQVI